MLAGEDFSYMLEQRPGAFIFIGNGDSAGLHSASYDFNDEIIPIGCSYWARLVETAMPACGSGAVFGGRQGHRCSRLECAAIAEARNRMMAFGLKLPKIARDGSLGLINRLLRETGREFAGRYAWAIGLSLVIAGTTALNAWLIKDIINKVFFDRDATMLWFLTAVIVTNGFVRGYSLYASSLTLGRIGNAVVARVQARLFNHMLNLGVDFYNRTPASDLVTRMSHNATAARQVLDTVINSAGRDFLSLVGLIIVMFIQSATMSLIILVVGPITIFSINKLVKRVRSVARAQFYSLSQVVSDMQETATGIRIVKAFNLEGVMRKRMAASIADVQARADKIVQISARTSPLMEVLGGFAIAMIVLWAGYQTIYFNVQPGALMSFIAAIALAYEPAKRLARMQISLEAGLVGVRLSLRQRLPSTPPCSCGRCRPSPRLPAVWRPSTCGPRAIPSMRRKPS